MKTINLIIAFALISISSMAQEYAYDALNRIKKVSYPSGQEVHYAYDELGNRTAKSAAEITAITETVVANSEIKVYPNPVSTQLTVELQSTELQIKKMELIDISGKKVWSQTQAPRTKTTIPITFGSGVYILNIYGANKLIGQEKIIVTSE